jgi:hypothetical protein
MTTKTASASKRNDAPHERLKAWHACHQLTQAIYHATHYWSLEDHRSLQEEVRKSAHAATVALMIGAWSEDPAELLKQSDDACGKLARVSVGLLLARDVDVIGRKEYGQLETLRDHAARLTSGLRAALRRQANGDGTSKEKTKGNPREQPRRNAASGFRANT